MTALDPRPIKTANLIVENVSCADCIGKIERTVNAMDGVTDARLNMSTRRLKVDWLTGTTDADAIADRVTALGYPAILFDTEKLQSSATREERRLLLAMAVAGFAAGNVMLLSVAVWAGAFSEMGPATRSLFHWISALIALPAIAFSCRPFLTSAWRSLKGGAVNMDVPISLAVLLSAGLSLQQTWAGGAHAYFDASVTLLFFLLVGRYLDHRMRAKARSAAEQLIALSSTHATRRTPNGEMSRVALETVMPGDVLVVAAGERIPADGTVRHGESDIDRSLVTGESVPEPAIPGIGVFAGTLNLTGALEIDVTAVGPDTFLAEVAGLMEAAEQGRAGYIRLADRAARIYAPVVHLTAAATFLLWWGLLGADWPVALITAISVLIITCPCALALAVPVVHIVASSLLFQRGILVKSGDALEKLAQADTVVFDKTGTLTLGKPIPTNLGDIAPDLVTLAASLAAYSRHPLSLALSNVHPGACLPVTDVQEFPGSGLEGTVDGRRVRLGRRSWCGVENENAPEASSLELWVSIADERAFRIEFEDQLRLDAAGTIYTLKAMGLEIEMLSGDRPVVAGRIAAELGISAWHADMRPDEKLRHIQSLGQAGRKLLMVGDGLNDAPALAAAWVSMAPAQAADVSRTAADLVFQGETLFPVAYAVKTARTANRAVNQNFGFSLLYNLIAVPIAVAGFATPLVAAVAMSTSSLAVTLNALRLRMGKAPK
ncbi:MAG: heavy metal translocating P-type ATPase [Proteobacteria bacterium]|nr:heavy metal translocating P-type ATPase [Pseudomonadota bacterium]